MFWQLNVLLGDSLCFHACVLGEALTLDTACILSLSFGHACTVKYPRSNTRLSSAVHGD